MDGQIRFEYATCGRETRIQNTKFTKFTVIRFATQLDQLQLVALIFKKVT